MSIQIHFTGLFLPWHRWYVYVFEQSLKNKCGYKGVSPYWDWTIGLQIFSSSYSKNSDGHVDAPNFYESSFWKDHDPKSGLGGWGDPKADFRVPDGGFNKLQLAYPSPHILRRNFTLLAFGSTFLPNMFFTKPLKEANESFSASAMKSLLENTAGDYQKFQTEFEAFEVRTWIWVTVELVSSS